MSKKDDTQKDSQNKLEAGKNALNTALGNKAGGPEPKPKPEMGGQKADKSNSPKPKPGGGGEKNDMMKNLLKAGLDLLQGKDPSKHLNKALGGIMKDMPGAPKAGGKANMGKDAKAGKEGGPMDMMKNNPMGGALKSAGGGLKGGPEGGAKGGPKGKPPKVPGM